MLLSDVCLTDVCLFVTYIGPKSRTERPRKTKIGTEIAHVTGDSLPRSKVKGQGHQAALLSTTLTRKAAAAVSMGTYSAWESTATLRLLGGADALRGPWGGKGLGHIVLPRAQLVI